MPGSKRMTPESARQAQTKGWDSARQASTKGWDSARQASKDGWESARQASKDGPVEDKQGIVEALSSARKPPLRPEGVDPSELEGLRAGKILSKELQPVFEELRQEQRNLEYMLDTRSGFEESVDGLAPWMRNKVFGKEWSGIEHINDTRNNINTLKRKLGIKPRGKVGAKERKRNFDDPGAPSSLSL